MIRERVVGDLEMADASVCAGWAVDEKTKRRGFLEDIRMGCELGVTSVFEAVRLVVRRVLALPARSSWTPTPRTPTARRRIRSEDPGIFSEVSRPSLHHSIAIQVNMTSESMAKVVPFLWMPCCQME